MAKVPFAFDEDRVMVYLLALNTDESSRSDSQIKIIDDYQAVISGLTGEDIEKEKLMRRVVYEGLIDNKSIHGTLSNLRRMRDSTINTDYKNWIDTLDDPSGHEQALEQRRKIKAARIDRYNKVYNALPPEKKRTQNTVRGNLRLRKLGGLKYVPDLDEIVEYVKGIYETHPSIRAGPRVTNAIHDYEEYLMELTDEDRIREKEIRLSVIDSLINKNWIDGNLEDLRRLYFSAIDDTPDGTGIEKELQAAEPGAVDRRKKYRTANIEKYKRAYKRLDAEQQETQAAVIATHGKKSTPDPSKPIVATEDLRENYIEATVEKFKSPENFAAIQAYQIRIGSMNEEERNTETEERQQDRKDLKDTQRTAYLKATSIPFAQRTKEQKETAQKYEDHLSSLYPQEQSKPNPKPNPVPKSDPVPKSVPVPKSDPPPKKGPTQPAWPLDRTHAVFAFLGDIDDTESFFTDKVKDPGKWSNSITGPSRRSYVTGVLAPLCKVFNNLNIPYVAMLGMTKDLSVLGSQLRLPVSEPSFTFTSKLKGIRLTEIPLGKNRRLLLMYLSYLMGKETHTDLYNAGNLAAVIYIKCSPTGITKFRISSVLSSGVAVTNPSFDAPPQELEPALVELFHNLLTFFPMMMNVMRESTAIDFVNKTWHFSKLLPAATLKSTVTAAALPPPFRGSPPSGG